MTRTASVFFASAICGCAAFAQVYSGMSASSDGNETTVTFHGTLRFSPRPVTGAPYSGDQVFERTQTLSDGTHITQSDPAEHVARDSQGRTRTEQPLRMGPVGQNANAPMLVQIVDPVAGVGYLLDDQNRIAHRVAMEPQQVRGVPTGQAGGGGGGRAGIAPGAIIGGAIATGAADSTRPQVSSEKLGTQMIEGVLAEGTRHTTTWPVGSQGNDRPMTDSSEAWISTELHVMVLSKSTSLRNGERVNKLTNISRAEPDPSLFQPPPDYTVVDDKDSVTLKFTRQQQ